MGGRPSFEGASQVTRRLLVDPAIALTAGLPGLCWRLAFILDYDRYRRCGAAALRVGGPHSQRVAAPRLVVERSAGPYVPAASLDRELVLVDALEGVGQVVAVVVGCGHRSADALTGPGVLVHAQSIDIPGELWPGVGEPGLSGPHGRRAARALSVRRLYLHLVGRVVVQLGYCYAPVRCVVGIEGRCCPSRSCRR